MSKTDGDEWLMRQVARGRRECLEALLRRHANALLTFITRMTGDRHRAEELFQEVFLAVWAKRAQYEYPRPFRAWLFGIAANKCRADYRGRSLARVLALSDDGADAPAAAEPGPVDTAIATETAALVGAAAGALPPQQRAVVSLRVWEGMTYAEIAEALGRTEATVRSNMHHGLTALRKYLEPRLQ